MEVGREFTPEPVKIISCNKHLPLFDDVSLSTGLFGKYSPSHKLLYYSLLSLRNREIVFKKGTNKVDLRINAIFAIDSGNGKGSYKRVLRNVSKGLSLETEVPTSHHPEQLIGKVISIKEKNPNGRGMIEIKVQNKGYFDADLVLFDEGETLLNSKDKQIEESREYICQATDVYGDNQVEKRSVNDLKKDKIKYCPKCNIVLFLQPITLNSRSIRKGFYRRFLTAFVKDKTPAKNIYEKRTTSNYDPDIYLKKITEYLKRLCVSNNFEFESDAFNSLGKYCLIILGHAKIKSNVTKQFCNLIEQQIFNDLIVFSILLAHSHKKYKISQDIVKLAFLDLIEIWISSFDFVDRYSTGQISYNRKWNSADERHIYVLNILEERECYDKDRSDISIRELENLIIKKFGVKERNAKRILSNMGQKRLIGKKQIGKNDSRVWLNVLPNKEKLLDYCPNAEYQKIIKEYDSLLRKINTESNKIVFVKNSTIMDNKKINSEEYIDNEDSFQKIHAFILTNQSNNYKLLLEEFGEEMISLCLKNGMICKSTPNTVRIN